MSTFFLSIYSHNLNKFVLASISLIQSCFCTNLFYDSCALDIIYSPNFLTQSHRINKEKTRFSIHLWLPQFALNDKAFYSLLEYFMPFSLSISILGRCCHNRAAEYVDSIISLLDYSEKYKNEIWNRKCWMKRNYRWFPVTDMIKSGNRIFVK